jgi:hypothetical protein
MGGAFQGPCLETFLARYEADAKKPQEMRVFALFVPSSAA